MNRETVRRLAFALPEAEEKSHFEKPDFRVRNHIFATLPEDGHAVVKLTRDQQEMLTASEPAIFQPVKGGWGRQGWTMVMLAAADELTLKSALADGLAKRRASSASQGVRCVLGWWPGDMSPPSAAIALGACRHGDARNDSQRADPGQRLVAFAKEKCA